VIISQLNLQKSVIVLDNQLVIPVTKIANLSNKSLLLVAFLISFSKLAVSSTQKNDFRDSMLNFFKIGPIKAS
jgi:hypothetical protein